MNYAYMKNNLNKEQQKKLVIAQKIKMGNFFARLFKRGKTATSYPPPSALKIERKRSSSESSLETFSKPHDPKKPAGVHAVSYTVSTTKNENPSTDQIKIISSEVTAEPQQKQNSEINGSDYNQLNNDSATNDIGKTMIPSSENATIKTGTKENNEVINKSETVKAEEELYDPKSLVTKEVIIEALKTDFGPNAELISFELVDFTKQGDNYATKVTSVICTYNYQEKSSTVCYIAKMQPGKNIMGDFVTEMFIRESGFLTEIVARLNEILQNIGESDLKLPKFVSKSLAPLRSILLTKDLRPKGFQMFDRKKGMDENHTLMVLEELARFHGSGFILKDQICKEKKGDLLSMFPYLTDAFLDEGTVSRSNMDFLINKMMSSTDIIESYEEYSQAVKFIKSCQGKGCQIYEQLLKSMPAQFTSICHGDVWNNNILFRYSDDMHPVDITLLDLQQCRMGSISLDLNYFLLSSLEGELRQERLDFFLASYHQKLEEIMEKALLKIPFTLEELKQEYFAKNVFGFLSCLMLIPLVMTETSEAPDLTAMENDEDMEKFFEESEAKKRRDMKINPMFKSRYLAVFKDCIESGSMNLD